MNCYRHPDRPAKRKCYKCKQPVCPECQLKLEGHIFCSENCHQEWLKKKEEHKQRSAACKAKPRQDVRLAVLEDKMEQSATNWSKLEASLRNVERNQVRIRTGTFIALAASIILVLAGALVIMFGVVNGWFKHRPAPQKIVAQAGSNNQF